MIARVASTVRTTEGIGGERGTARDVVPSRPHQLGKQIKAVSS